MRSWRVIRAAVTIVTMAVLAAPAARAQGPAAKMPEAVWMFEQLVRNPEAIGLFAESRGPIFAADDPRDSTTEYIGLGGLDVCSLLARWERSDKKQVLFALPADKGSEAFAHRYQPTTRYSVPFYFKSDEHRARCAPMLDDGRLVLAYGGWCTAGVEDPSPVGPHFSASHAAPFRFEAQLTPSGRTVTVLYLNHYTKALVTSDEAGREAARKFFADLDAGKIRKLDIRGAGVPVFFDEALTYTPVVQGIHWKR